MTVAGGDRDSYDWRTLAMITLPGAPCIYYGDEVGIEGRHDPDCRRAFPWDESRWDRELLEFVRALARAGTPRVPAPRRVRDARGGGRGHGVRAIFWPRRA